MVSGSHDPGNLGPMAEDGLTTLSCTPKVFQETRYTNWLELRMGSINTGVDNADGNRGHRQTCLPN
jgi:hypothetical protein